MGRPAGCFCVPTCCVPETFRRWIHRYFSFLRISARAVSATLFVFGSATIAWFTLVYFYFVHPYLFPALLESALVTPLAIFLVCGIFYMWTTTIHGDPGYASARVPLSDGDVADADADADADERRRHCAICKVDRFETAHHCRVCNRCVDKMDHHCPFLGNCVGAKNRGRFLVLLLYVTVGSAYTALASGARLLDGRSLAALPSLLYGEETYYSETDFVRGHIVGVGAFAAMLAVAFGSLLVWFTYLAALGVTSIQLWMAFVLFRWRQILPLLVPRDAWRNLDVHLAPHGLRPSTLLWFRW
jgi:hypothetical protein